MRSTLILDGLNCPHCAAKIEDKIRSDSRFADVEFNFINKELKLTHELGDAVTAEIDSIVAGIEDGVTVLRSDEEHKHGHHHSHDEEVNIPVLIARAAAIAVLIALYFIFSKQPLFLILAYIAAGGDVIYRAVRNIGKGRIFDENFLMTIATAGAIIIGEYPEALAVMIFYQIGEFFQDMAVEKSKQSIGDLLDLKIENVNIVRESGIETIDPKEVESGDILLIKKGEKIPVDGVVTEGSAVVDTSALTGESLPREINTGEKILSGCINCGEAIKIRAESRYNNSTAAKIAKMAEDAAAHKAKAETFIGSFAKVYTPVVVVLALLIAVIPCIALGFDTKWIYRGLVFLVASCPCALVLSVPLCFFSGIGKASKQGVLIKGGNFIQVLSNIKAIAFDKTGTLTTGRFTVTADDDKTLALAAGLEQYSSHPIAKAVTAAYKGELPEVSEVREESGYGVCGIIGGRQAAVGSRKYMEKLGIDISGINGDVYTAVDGKATGGINVYDEIKKDSAATVRALEAAGIKTVMLTGDKKESALNVGREIGISAVEYELLPSDKTAAVERIKAQYGTTGFMGDGINDAPVLAAADIGMAMGGMGSDAAIEAADMVIMGDDPSAALRAVRTAKRTMAILWQNVVFIIVVKALILTLTAVGISNMWLAVFADVGTALISVLNSLRIVNDIRIPQK